MLAGLVRVAAVRVAAVLACGVLGGAVLGGGDVAQAQTTAISQASSQAPERLAGAAASSRGPASSSPEKAPSRHDPAHVVTGIERPGREPGEAARGVANVLLFVPRNVIDLLFRGTEAAANLVADEQLVPRYRRLLGAPEGAEIFVFPTLFAETGSLFSVGLRMIADTEHVATSQRFGFGGLNDVVVDSRVVFKGGRRLPFAVSLESFYELTSETRYYGLGNDPDSDRRNHRRLSASSAYGLYSERYARAVGTIGLRMAPSFEFFLSASLSRRAMADTPDAGDLALSQVFEASTVPGFGLPSWIGYAEMAARFDSRRYRTKPSPGVLMEAYTGGAHSTEGPRAAFMRVGWRLGAFVPIYRKTNILAPRLVFDRLVPLSGLDVPFAEVPRQPDFRGFDHRRDLLSVVASVDYTWQLVPFMGLRLFADVATVEEGVARIRIETIKNARYAAGLGVDFFTKTAEIGRVAMATSPEGIRLLLSFGVPEGFGDRQHRD